MLLIDIFVALLLFYDILPILSFEMDHGGFVFLRRDLFHMSE